MERIINNDKTDLRLAKEEVQRLKEEKKLEGGWILEFEKIISKDEELKNQLQEKVSGIIPEIKKAALELNTKITKYDQLKSQWQQHLEQDKKQLQEEIIILEKMINKTNQE